MDTTEQNLTTKKEPWPKWSKAFLTSLSKLGVVGHAAKAAKISRTSAYNLRSEDKDFAAAWDVALNDAIDIAEKEAWRRAVKGCKKPVYQGGERVGFIQEYSDTLLIFMLKSHRPKVYREKVALEVGGPDGGPVPIAMVEMPGVEADASFS